MKTTYLLKQGQIHTLETSRLDNLFKGKSHADTTLFNIFFLPLLVIPHLLKEDLCRYLHRSNDVVVWLCL